MDCMGLLCVCTERTVQGGVGLRGEGGSGGMLALHAPASRTYVA